MTINELKEHCERAINPEMNIIEELKAIKENAVFYSNRPIEDIALEARADAIDEFVNMCKTNHNHLITNWNKPFGIDFEGIDAIAEQLKEKKKEKDCNNCANATNDFNEKQIPKKVIFVHPLQEDDDGDYICPTCKSGTVYDPYGNKPPYCHYCGQAIKWE